MPVSSVKVRACLSFQGDYEILYFILFFSVQETHVLRGMLGWWVGQMPRKEELKFAEIMSGVPYATTTGVTKILMSSVHSWDCKVNY